MPQVFKIGSYWVYFWSDENKPLEPNHVLNNIIKILEARSSEIVEKWEKFFGQISYYCQSFEIKPNYVYYLIISKLCQQNPSFLHYNIIYGIKV